MLALIALGGCSRLARCEIDRVQSEVQDYHRQMEPLQPAERALEQRIAEFDGKIFTNQKAGVDLLRAVLVRQTREHVANLKAVTVRSRLLRPPHRKKIQALEELAGAYEQLMEAYPREDFEAIRAGLRRRKEAMRELAEAKLRIARLLRKYDVR